eukprot:TRINITY_DN13646_c0_g1_i1.p1 TRINITY_DN13646_c0_g1~~TRINITY_DN13646_c0_g1_i1.p1  ORF type:complete len:476 (+),score=101.21 TRINITY_DN13646_c0_g1_i1:103-1530(+)
MAQPGGSGFMGVPFGVPAGINGAVMSSAIRQRMAGLVERREQLAREAEEERAAAAQAAAVRPPRVLVDAVYTRGSSDAKQKPLMRHVIVKDLNKVASQLKFELPTDGIFEGRAPMGLYCLFDGMCGAGKAGPAAAEFCARNFHTALLTCLSELGAFGAKAVELAVLTSLKKLDKDLLEKNESLEDGCGAAVALLVGDYMFVALLGRCGALLCEVDSEGQRSPKSLGGSPPALKCSLGDRSMKHEKLPTATSSAAVETVQLGGAEKHPFLVLLASTVSEAISPAGVLSIADSFMLQPRAFCGELTARAECASMAPCTAIQIHFLPEADAISAEVAAAPAAKKAKTEGAGVGGPSQSMRLRHILVKFHEGAKPPEDPRAKWASRTRAEAEKILRGVIAEVRQDGFGERKFIQLARQHSDCETRHAGALACGDLGWLTQEARAAMSDSFREVCDVLKPGQWSDIVASSKGLHLVQRVA